MRGTSPIPKAKSRFRLESVRPISAGPGRRSHVVGERLDKYKEIAEVRFKIVDPRTLVFTNGPRHIDTILDLCGAWKEHFIRHLYTGEEFPKICPIAINGDGVIYDGNHRAAAAILNSSRIPAILVETQNDLDAIERLEKHGLYKWPHEYDIIKLESRNPRKRLEYWDYAAYFEKLKEKYNPKSNKRADTFYFSGNPLSEQSLQYLLARTIKNGRIGGGLPDYEFYFRAFISEAPGIKEGDVLHKVQDELMRIGAKIANMAPHIKNDVADAIQWTLTGLWKAGVFGPKAVVGTEHADEWDIAVSDGVEFHEKEEYAEFAISLGVKPENVLLREYVTLPKPALTLDTLKLMLHTHQVLSHALPHPNEMLKKK